MKVNRIVGLFVASTLCVSIGLTGAPASTWASPESFQQAANGAAAELHDATGATVGKATLVSDSAGMVRVQVQLQGFTTAAPSPHGIHIHTVGKCEAPQFTTAGGHFNPASKKHGLNNPEGPHAGDLPNLTVGADGSATYEATTDMVSLGTGAPNSIFDADGSAIVIHAGPDDYMTDPAGNSGTRIACGVLSAAVIPVGMPGTGEHDASGLYLWLSAVVAILSSGLIARRKGRTS